MPLSAWCVRCYSRSVELLLINCHSLRTIQRLANRLELGEMKNILFSSAAILNGGDEFIPNLSSTNVKNAGNSSKVIYDVENAHPSQPGFLAFVFVTTDRNKGWQNKGKNLWHFIATRLIRRLSRIGLVVYIRYPLSLRLAQTLSNQNPPLKTAMVAATIIQLKYLQCNACCGCWLLGVNEWMRMWSDVTVWILIRWRYVQALSIVVRPESDWEHSELAVGEYYFLFNAC